MTSERIKEIQETTAYPDSLSVKQALLQVWNECGQEKSYSEEDLSSFIAFVKDIESNWDCDSDSHRYGTPCRSCEATKLLVKLNKL